jgi:hypothetical protein
MGLIKGPYVSPWQQGDVLLCSRIENLDDFGQGGDRDGVASFVAPTRGRVVQALVAADDGLNNDLLNMRFRKWTGGAISLASEAIQGPSSGVGWSLYYPDSESAGHCEKGNVISLEGDAGPTAASGRCGAYLLFRPDMDGELPAGAVILSYINQDGTAAFDISWPSIGLECLELQAAASEIATGTCKFDLDDNAGTEIATCTVPILETGGAYATSGRIIAATRFVTAGQRLRVSVETPDAGATSQYPFNVICRRL